MSKEDRKWLDVFRRPSGALVKSRTKTDEAITSWLNKRNEEGYRLHRLKGDCVPQGEDKVILYQIVVMESDAYT